MTSATPPQADTQLERLESYITLSVQLLQQLQKGDLVEAAQTAKLIETSAADASGGVSSEHTPARAVLNLYREAFPTASQPLKVEEREEESQDDEDEIESSTSDAALREDATTRSSESAPGEFLQSRSSCTGSSTTTESESEDEESSTSSGDSIDRGGLLQQRPDDVPTQRNINSDEIDVNAQLLDIISKIKNSSSRKENNGQSKMAVGSLAKVLTSVPNPQIEPERDDEDSNEDEIRQMERRVLADIDQRVKEEMERLAIVRKHR